MTRPPTYGDGDGEGTIHWIDTKLIEEFRIQKNRRFTPVVLVIEIPTPFLFTLSIRVTDRVSFRSHLESIILTIEGSDRSLVCIVDLKLPRNSTTTVIDSLLGTVEISSGTGGHDFVEYTLNSYCRLLEGRRG